jgi:hypothetical protein
LLNEHLSFGEKADAVLAAANRFCKQFVHRSAPVGRCYSPIDLV